MLVHSRGKALEKQRTRFFLFFLDFLIDFFDFLILLLIFFNKVYVILFSALPLGLILDVPMSFLILFCLCSYERFLQKK